MKTLNNKEVFYCYSYFEEKAETFAKLFAPKIASKLPKISLALPQMEIIESLESAAC